MTARHPIEEYDHQDFHSIVKIFFLSPRFLPSGRFAFSVPCVLSLASAVATAESAGVDSS